MLPTTCLDIFVAIITNITFLGNVRPTNNPAENVSRIQEVQFFCINNSAYDDLSSLSDALASPSFFDGIEGNRDPYASAASMQSVTVLEHPCEPLTKILGNGTFYYATRTRWDISTRLSARMHRPTHDLAQFDERFIWNHYIAQPLLSFREQLGDIEMEELDSCQFLVSFVARKYGQLRNVIPSQVLAIQGFVGVFDLPLPAPPTHGSPIIGTLAVISRLGSKRAGTRFNTRGVDDDGNTANFVEVHSLIPFLLPSILECKPERLSVHRRKLFSAHPTTLSVIHRFVEASHVGCPASRMPFHPLISRSQVFWEQQGIQTFGQKIQITRPQIASQPAFDRHFLQLTDEYDAIHAINLLGTKENEAILSETYTAHIKAAGTASSAPTENKVGLTHFDFHQAVRAAGHESVARELKRLPGVQNGIDDFGFCTVDVGANEVVTQQKGVFRTNCLDWLVSRPLHCLCMLIAT